MDFGIVLDAFVCWVLSDFGGGEILDISIPTLIPPSLSNPLGVDCVGFWARHCCSVVLVPVYKYGGWKGD